jgi:hypothetical protein
LILLLCNGLPGLNLTGYLAGIAGSAEQQREAKKRLARI